MVQQVKKFVLRSVHLDQTSGSNDHVACLVYLDIVRSISESRPATISLCDST